MKYNKCDKWMCLSEPQNNPQAVNQIRCYRSVNVGDLIFTEIRTKAYNGGTRITGQWLPESICSRKIRVIGYQINKIDME